MALLICPNCNGEHIHDRMIHCPLCADPLVSPETVCSKCSEALLPSFAACGACGTTVPGKRLRPRRPPPISHSVDSDTGAVTITIPKGARVPSEIQALILQQQRQQIAEGRRPVVSPGKAEENREAEK